MATKLLLSEKVVRASRKLVLAGFLLMYVVAGESLGFNRPISQSAQALSKDCQRKAKLQFKRVKVGEIRDKDGLVLSITAYEGSDGSALSEIHNKFPGDLAAQEYFDTKIKGALRVVRKEQKRSKTGAIVGERAEVILRETSSTHEIFGVLLTYGPNFLEILSSSKSFKDCRALERFLAD